MCVQTLSPHIPAWTKVCHTLGKPPTQGPQADGVVVSRCHVTPSVDLLPLFCFLRFYKIWELYKTRCVFGLMIYMSRTHWVARGTGTPKDRDEVNRQEVCEWDGWVCDFDVTGQGNTKLSARTRMGPEFSFWYKKASNVTKESFCCTEP
jgi:hypothetical protein